MSDGYVRTWNCELAKGVVALVHGLGEFCDRYDAAAQTFVQHGYAVIGIDLPGHGRTPGRSGHIDRFGDFLDAVDDVVTQAHTAYPDLPVILFGHSMGGLIVIRYLQTRTVPASIQAVILSSPSIQLVRRVPSLLRIFLRGMSRIWPTFLQATGIAPEHVSRASEVQDFYKSNNLVLHKVSMRLLAEFFAAMDEVVGATAVSIRCPILVTQAGQDRVVAAAATQSFYEQIRAPGKRFILYPDCYHELLNEPERDQIITDMTTWLEEQTLTGSALM